jgi:hypothetical protein
MTDRRSTSISVFDEPRQAFGWLVSLWAGYLIPVYVWPWFLLQDRTQATEWNVWVSAGSTILILSIGAANIWGYWVSSETRARLKEAARHRGLAWWERDRFASEHAAQRLGWSPRPVILTTRALLCLALITTLLALGVLLARWW